MIYLDTSALASLFLPEPRSDQVSAIVAASDAILISDLAVGEFGAAIANAVRIGQLTELQALALLRDFDEWRLIEPQPIMLQSRHLRFASDWVRRFDLALRLPDALHIAICRHLPVRLITGDKVQAAAAEILGVSVELV